MIRVTTLGDSISAGAPGWDPDPATRAARGAHDPESQWQHWAALADPRLAFSNHGVCLERTDEIAARLEGAVDGADVLIVQGGINDVVQGRDVGDAAADLRRMVRRGRELGLAVAIAEVLPWNAGWPEAEPRIRALNALIGAIGREEGVTVLPFHDTLEDDQRPGRVREEWTADGSHPSVAGHRRLGEVAFALP